MEDGLHTVLFEVSHEGGTRFHVVEQNVEQMIVAGAVFWNMGKAQQAFLLQWLQVMVIYLVDSATARGDSVQHLQLGIEKGTADFTIVIDSKEWNEVLRSNSPSSLKIDCTHRLQSQFHRR